MEKYDKIGINYNETRRPDPYLVSRLFHHLQPQKVKTYLDIGCGTGNYTIELHKKGVDFIGIEPSGEMLKVAKSKCSTIEWKKGKVEAIPLRNESVDGVLGSLTIHHWSDLKKGFQELHRVSKTKSRLVIFTSTPEQMNGYWLNHYFPKMLADSKVQMPNLNIVIECLKQANFRNITTEKYFIQNNLQDLFLYAGKNRPELYLNPNVRKGISSFSALANQKEVQRGLKQLEQDITTNDIQEIIAKYENDKGDYLYIIAEK
jgi:ubiquinone/menaquinone biosynthesis C-methylase UbiE